MDDKQARKNEGGAGRSVVSEKKGFIPGLELAPTVIKHTLGHVSTAIVQAACKLEIFDHLHDNGPEMAVGALAEKMGASEINLIRLMNACFRLDLLKAKTTESGEILYSNTEETEMFLRKQSERSLVPYVNWVNTFQKKLFGLIDEAVMKGGPILNYKEVFGISKEDASLPYVFDQALGSASQPIQHFPQLFDFSRFQTLIDCGGGVGIQAKSMKQAYPAMEISVLEIEAFINRLKMQGKSLDNQYFKYICGDFFCSLPSADLYLLSHILHNWPDKKCDIILHNVYKALPSGGGLIIIDKLYNESKDSTVDLAKDMSMMVVCNGKERTREEYKLMLEKHGFIDIKIWAEVAQSLADVIFAQKL